MADGQHDERGHGTTRRTALRVAANSVWAVPVIAIATAAPASAVGSPVGSLVVSQASWNGGLLGLGASATGTVQNNGTVAFVSPIVLTFNVGLGVSALPSISGSGWTLTSSLSDLVGLGTITVAWTGTLAPGASTSQVSLNWLISLNLTSRSAIASGTDTYGHKVNSPSKSF
ncbi:MAG: hypothetical protein FWE71_05940 [Nocardioidaceae bacterium]|nr:hypothetical protein [Nocardioidaceae bacterium]MCL2613026.1 hypothetical protein [Nocardioidaceae bacterium]